MRTDHLLKRLLAAGILGLTVGACSSSDNNNGGSGGSGNQPQGSGGNGIVGTGGTATGGAVGTGGVVSTGGVAATGGSSGAPGTGGTAQLGTGGTTVQAGTGGRLGTGGRAAGGTTSTGGAGGGSGKGGSANPTGGTGPGGATGTGGGATGGTAGASGTGGSKTTGGSTGTGTCTASKSTGKSVSGSGPHKVVVESNSDSKISCGTIYRPAELGGDEKYPIFVWGEGACTRDGNSNAAAMAEIASYGYFVIADGPSGGGGGNCGTISMSTDVAGMAKPLIGYIDWAIAENGKSCSAYYGSIDTTKISADGFSCGGLMAMGTAGDPRMTAFGYSSSGLTSSVASYFATVHTPVKILVGGQDGSGSSSDVAYPNGTRDYDDFVKAGTPVIYFSKKGAPHGGDLGSAKGDFNTINLAWLNWQLKGDTGATGKGLLMGASCKFCNNSSWIFKSSKLE